jgi:hypothetical protein
VVLGVNLIGPCYSRGFYMWFGSESTCGVVARRVLVRDNSLVGMATPPVSE